MQSSIALLSLALASSAVGQTFRSYHVGNSLTGQTLGNAGFQIDDLTSARGINAVWGYHIRCGSQLNQVYADPTGVCTPSVEPYGTFGNALPNYVWDAVTLQPYGDPMPAGRSAANNLINVALQQSANSSASFYIMEMWPQGESSDSYATRWNRAYNETIDDPESRWSKQYFMDFTQHLRQDRPDLKVGMVLSGEVIFKFDQLAQQGQISGYTSASQLYVDPYHLSTNGNYLSRLTLFATQHHTSPVGLPVPSNVTFSPEDVLQLQQTVWETVTTNASLSLVLAADANRDLKVSSTDFNLLAGNFGASTYLNRQGDFDGNGQVNSLDFNVLSAQYGTSLISAPAPGSVVPEPSFVIFLPAMLLIIRRRDGSSRQRRAISSPDRH
jgi:hypothetical protein